MRAATGLRPVTRDRLIVQQMNDHLTRYRVPMMLPEPELFIDHETIKDLRECPCCAYAVYQAGAGPTGIALRIGAARSLGRALELVNLKTGRTTR